MKYLTFHGNKTWRKDEMEWNKPLSDKQIICIGFDSSFFHKNLYIIVQIFHYHILIKDFDHTLIGECISLGLARTQVGASEHGQTPPSTQPSNTTPSSTAPSSGGGEHPSQATPLDALLKASMPTLITHLKAFAALVPRPHQILEPTSESQEAKDYYSKMMECFQDPLWCNQLDDIIWALSRYFVACRTLKLDLDMDASESMMSLTISALEVGLQPFHLKQLYPI